MAHLINWKTALASIALAILFVGCGPSEATQAADENSKTTAKAGMEVEGVEMQPTDAAKNADQLLGSQADN